MIGRKSQAGALHVLCLFKDRENVISELEGETKRRVSPPKLAEVCEHFHTLARLQ